VNLLRVVAIAAAAGAIEATRQDFERELRSVAAAYYAKAGQIALVAGPQTTMDYYDRLLEDVLLVREPPPAGYSAPSWQAAQQAAGTLDLSLATQLLQRTYQPMAAIRGLGEALVRSSKDATMQPLAVYVPSGYAAERPAPLLVFLHGRDQTESHLLAPQYLQELAERSGTIVVAPYGRGAYDFEGAESDVYDALDAASRAFAVDPRRRYLAGYSMGGFSVFRVAPIRPSDWAGVMSIAGSLLGSRAPRLVAAMHGAPFYVLTGARDDNVPTQWPTATAIFLRNAGVPVTFYSQPDGTHALYSLQPILAQAWYDMEHGIVRSPAGLTGAPNLPEQRPGQIYPKP
jgi:dienelactone hydrolase